MSRTGDTLGHPVGKAPPPHANPSRSQHSVGAKRVWRCPGYARLVPGLPDLLPLAARGRCEVGLKRAVEQNFSKVEPDGLGAGRCVIVALG